MGGGGLYNMSLAGTGWVAVMSDGPPVLLSTGPETPTFADPQAAITWSGNLQTTVKTDVNLKTFIGKGSGESVQIGFVGQGWVLVQPSEGTVAPTTQGGGGQQGAEACWASSAASRFAQSAVLCCARRGRAVGFGYRRAYTSVCEVKRW